MPKDAGFSKIVAMRDYLSGWPEAKPIKSANSKSEHLLSSTGLLGLV